MYIPLKPLVSINICFFIFSVSKFSKIYIGFNPNSFIRPAGVLPPPGQAGVLPCFLAGVHQPNPGEAQAVFNLSVLPFSAGCACATKGEGKGTKDKVQSMLLLPPAPFFLLAKQSQRF